MIPAIFPFLFLPYPLCLEEGLPQRRCAMREGILFSEVAVSDSSPMQPHGH